MALTSLPRVVQQDLSKHQRKMHRLLRRTGMLVPQKAVDAANKGFFLADEMGMGKTRMMIACFAMPLIKARYLKGLSSNLLVVAPRSVITWWTGEFRRIGNQFTSAEPDSFPRIWIDTLRAWCTLSPRMRSSKSSQSPKPPDLPTATIIVTTYDLLLSSKRLNTLLSEFTPACPLTACMWDEASRACNPDTKIAQAKSQICDVSQKVIDADGTPVRNNIARDLSEFARNTNHSITDMFPSQASFFQSNPHRLFSRIVCRSVRAIQQPGRTRVRRRDGIARATYTRAEETGDVASATLPNLEMQIRSVWIKTPLEKALAKKAYIDFKVDVEKAFKHLARMRSIIEFPPMYIKQVRANLERFPRKYLALSREKKAVEGKYGLDWMLDTFFYMLPSYMSNLIRNYLKTERYHLGVRTREGYTITRAACQQNLNEPAIIMDSLMRIARRTLGSRYQEQAIRDSLSMPLEVFCQCMLHYGAIPFSKDRYNMVVKDGLVLLQNSKRKSQCFDATEVGRSYSDTPLPVYPSPSSGSGSIAVEPESEEGEIAQDGDDGDYRLVRMHKSSCTHDKSVCTAHKAIIDIVKEHCGTHLTASMENTQRMIVSCYYRKAGMQLKDAIEDPRNGVPKYIQVKVINGDSTPEDLAELGHDDSPYHVFIVNLSIVYAGMNLQHINIVVSSHGLWTPGAFLQFMARCWRRGQKRPVKVIHLITRVRDEEVATHSTMCANTQLRKLRMLKQFWEDIGSERSLPEEMFEEALAEFIENEFTPTERGTAIDSDDEDGEEE